MNIYKKLNIKQVLFLLAFLIYPLFIFITLYQSQHFIIHITISCIISSILLSRIKNTILKNLLTTIIFLIIGCQIAHIAETGRYIIEMTLVNITETSSVSNYTIIKSTFIALFLTIYGFLHVQYLNKQKIHINKYIIIILCIIFFIGTKNPIINFSSEIYQLIYNIIRFDYNEEEHIKQQDLYRKHYIYKNNKKEVPNLKNKNIITLFTEALSLKIIGPFNNQYDNLTPNLDNFLKQSIYFENYYNHTAATYTSIRGQLTSSYQMMSGIKDKEANKNIFYNMIIDLPHILKKNGYHTYFLSAHNNDSPLNNMLETMDFDKIYGADDYKKDKTQLTDQELFSFLYDLINNKKLKEPYFIGIYTLGTHLGMDSPDIKYSQNGKTDNPILNRFHNYDNAFGKFFSKIKKYQKNKFAIIQTADHALIPTPLFCKSFNNCEEETALGKVPLLLWTSNISPKKINVNGKNSLDFAPTLLNMLRIKNGLNYFLGCSLFDDNCKLDFEYTECVGTFVQTTKNNTRILLNPTNKNHKKIFDKVYKSFNLSSKGGYNRYKRWKF